MYGIIRNLGFGAVLALSATAAQADDVKLPAQMTWTACGTSSTGYQQSVALGNMLKSKFNSQVNVKTGKNDIARMLPIKSRKADFCACGIALYFAQEGVYEFGAKSWGPQPIRMVFASIGGAGIGLAVAKDIGVTHYKDMKGKRVAWVRSAPALNQNATSALRFGGLTWDDVKKVEFGGFKASLDGIINGQVDAAASSSVSPHISRIEASPRGVAYLNMDHKDAEGWKRLQGAAPWMQRHMATQGPGFSKESPWEGSGYFYPVLLTNDDYDSTTVYSLVKAIDTSYDDFKTAAPGVDGWARDRQGFQWVIPWHDGAVKYWKEVGVWTADMEAHQAQAVKRQKTLTDAWKAYSANPAADFEAGWLEARAAALNAMGMDVVFD
jgi:TRAP transporter TAXI family solute receptor